ncbi:MAG: hypothetical protein Ct9H300mP13_2600 [Gammaproteobacteria bacterium]|nr:MAG: hypothetical protein Ct9H300mP13_2600 [Gammaproteobacteria bacterium]
MLLEDMGLAPMLNTPIRLRRVRHKLRQRTVSSLIIGCGVSGICMAVHLIDLACPIPLLKKTPRLVEPGLKILTRAVVLIRQSLLFFFFEPNHDWPDFFSKREELYDYLDTIVDKYDVRPHVRFNTQVVSARYQSADRCWHVKTQKRPGNANRPAGHFPHQCGGGAESPVDS